jgi:hypothetical protein
MRAAFWSRRLHKWLALIVGVQAVLWMVSGLYMTAISIDIIHGDHLAHKPVATLPISQVLVDPAELARQYPDIRRYKLKALLGRAVYEVHHADGVALLDAASGKPAKALDEADIGALARAAFHGKGALEKVELIHEIPSEMGGRPGPMWRVDFDDAWGTALYFSPTTGDFLGKRHDLWRAFDFLWMLHIMDYESREDINNNLLRIAAAVGTAFALSGVWLLLYSFRRKGAA